MLAETVAGYIAVGDGRLYWEATGEGPAVVAIHGASVDLRMWEGQAAALADSYRVIRYDMRGLGRSDPPTIPYRMSDDITVVLNHLSEPRAAVVGFSTGGAVAAEFAIRHPERTSALVTFGAIIPAEREPEGFEEAAQELVALLAPRERARQHGDLAEAARADLDVWATVHSGAARARLMTWMNDNPYFFTAMGEYEELGPISDADLAAMAVPALVMVGDHDVRLARLWAEHLAQTIPGALLQVVADADHFVSSARPDFFGASLRACLNESLRR